MDSSGKTHLVLWVEEDPFFRAHLGYFIDLLDKYEEEEKENFNSVSIRWTSAKSQKVYRGYSDLTLEKIGMYHQPCVHIFLFGSLQLMEDDVLETKDISPQAEMIDKFLRHAALHPEQGFLFVGALPINEPLDDGWSPRKVGDYDNLCQKFNLHLHQEVSSYLDGDLSWSRRRDGALGNRKRWNCRYIDPASFLCDPKTEKLARNAHQRDGITLTQSAIAHIFPHLLVSATSLFRAMEHEKRIKEELEDEELPPLESADESVDEAGTGRSKTPTSGDVSPGVSAPVTKTKRDRPPALSRLRSCLKRLDFKDEELQELLASDPKEEEEGSPSPRYPDWDLKARDGARPKRHLSLRSFLNKERSEDPEPEDPLAKGTEEKGIYFRTNPFSRTPKPIPNSFLHAFSWTPNTKQENKKDEPAETSDTLATDDSKETSTLAPVDSEKDTSPEQTAPVIEASC